MCIQSILLLLSHLDDRFRDVGRLPSALCSVFHRRLLYLPFNVTTFAFRPVLHTSLYGH